MEFVMCWGTGRNIYKLYGERDEARIPEHQPADFVIGKNDTDSAALKLQRKHSKEDSVTFENGQVYSTENQLHYPSHPKEGGGTDVLLFTRRRLMYKTALE